MKASLYAAPAAHSATTQSARCQRSSVRGLIRNGAPKAPRSPPVRSGASPARRSVRACAAPESQGYPFTPAAFNRVQLQLIQTEGDFTRAQGRMVLTRTDSEAGDGRGLVLQVNGDTLIHTAMTAGSQSTQRPLALDLLWSIISHARQEDAAKWTVQKVAIVALTRGVFIGRLFFGSEDGSTWDVDCRASDGCWLALKSGCPLYVSKVVWEEAAMYVGDLSSLPPGTVQQINSPEPQPQPAQSIRRTPEEQDARMPAASKILGNVSQLMAEMPPNANVLTTITVEDHPTVRLLKRQVEVAIAEEDYERAASLRDHPILATYASMMEARADGAVSRARELEEKMLQEIAQHENGADTDL